MHKRSSENTKLAAPDNCELLTVHDVAAWIKVSHKTVYNWAYRNFIPRVKFGDGLLRFRRDEISAWIASKCLST